jgi:hypothetical protein
MLGKLLLTAAIIVLAFYAIRQRAGGAGSGGPGGAGTRQDARAGDAPASFFARRNLIQTAAALVVIVMLAGSALALWQGWTRGHDVVTVEVANPITGAVEQFEAKRTDVGERTIRTLDGRRIRVSEVERIIIRD